MQVSKVLVVISEVIALLCLPITLPLSLMFKLYRYFFLPPLVKHDVNLGMIRANNNWYTLYQYSALFKWEARAFLQGLVDYYLITPKLPPVKVPTPEELGLFLLYTCIGSSLKRNETGFYADMSCFNAWDPYFSPGYFLDARQVQLDKDGVVITITLKTDDGFETVDKTHTHWELALLHAASTFGCLMLARTHNFSHFHLSAAVTTILHKTKDRYLLEVFEPFIMFNITTNEHGLGGLVTGPNVNAIQGFQQKLTGLLVQHLDVVKIPTQVFDQSIAEEVLRFYSNNPNTITSLVFGFPFSYQGVSMGDRMFEAPPYVKWLSKLYLYYYEYAEAVIRCSPNPTVFMNWMNESLELAQIRQFKCVDVIHFVATLMWIFSIQHSMDHYTHSMLFRNYGIPFYSTQSWQSKVNPVTKKSRIVTQNFCRSALVSFHENSNASKPFTIAGLVVPPELKSSHCRLNAGVSSVVNETAAMLKLTPWPTFSSISF